MLSLDISLKVNAQIRVMNPLICAPQPSDCAATKQLGPLTGESPATSRSRIERLKSDLLVEAPWPKVDAESALKLGDGRKVRPGPASKNGEHRRGVHANIQGRSPNAAVADGGLNVEGELTRDLSDGVYRRHFGPTVREFAWGGSMRPGHRTSVDGAEAGA